MTTIPCHLQSSPFPRGTFIYGCSSQMNTKKVTAIAATPLPNPLMVPCFIPPSMPIIRRNATPAAAGRSFRSLRKNL